MDSQLIFLTWLHLGLFLIPTLIATAWASFHHWEVREPNLPYDETELEHHSWRPTIPSSKSHAA